MRNVPFLIAACCATFTFHCPAVVGQVPDLATCAVMEKAEDRLACFDAAAGVSPTSSNDTLGASHDGASTQWQYVETEGDLGEIVARAVNTAVQVVSEYTKEAELNIRCRDGKLEGYIVWFTTLTGTDSFGEAPRLLHRVRIDEQPVFSTQNWGTSSTRTATFFTQHSSNLLEQLLGARRFAVQVHPTYKTAIAATFDVEGGEDALNKVLNACGVDSSKFGKQGIFGLQAQPVSGAQSSSDTPKLAAPVTRTYTPTRGWSFERLGHTAMAHVLSQSRKSAVVLECSRGRQGFTFELHSPEGWTRYGEADVMVDGRRFKTGIDGAGEDLIFSDDPDGGLMITDELLASLNAGSIVEFVGSATEQMPDGARVFSLRGSSSAIRALRSHCGL